MRRTERGSAAVLAVVILGVLTTVGVLLSVVGGAVVAQRRVESAADLGALAGASAAQRGDDACAAARSVAAANQARVTACSVGGATGDEVTVRTERRTQGLLGLSFRVSSRARAGPATLTAP